MGVCLLSSTWLELAKPKSNLTTLPYVRLCSSQRDIIRKEQKENVARCHYLLPISEVLLIRLFHICIILYQLRYAVPYEKVRVC